MNRGTKDFPLSAFIWVVIFALALSMAFGCSSTEPIYRGYEERHIYHHITEKGSNIIEERKLSTGESVLYLIHSCNGGSVHYIPLPDRAPIFGEFFGE